MSQSDYISKKKKHSINKTTCEEQYVAYYSIPYEDTEGTTTTYNNNNVNKIIDDLYEVQYELSQSEYLNRKKLRKTEINNSTKVMGSQQYSKNKALENKKCVQSKFRQYNEKLFEEPIKYEYNYVDFANEYKLCNGEYRCLDYSQESILSQSEYLTFKKFSMIDPIVSDHHLHSQLISLYSNVAYDIDLLLKASIDGNFDYVKNTLDANKYNYYSELLADERCEKLPSYENIRSIIVNVLALLSSTIILEENLNYTISELQKAIKSVGIVEPPKTSLDVTQDIDTVAEIKPEYLEYVKVFGAPKNGVFEPDKIAYIISLLNK